ncbi:MAG: hypothetical protein M3O46_10770 [Myxococcota bacterium]|nr:hypothetical protein [Myxococcota bacterium]
MTTRAHSEGGSTVAILVVPAAVVVAGALLALRLYYQPPTVPPYRLAGRVGGSAEEIALLPGTRVEMELRPTEPVTGAVGARGFLLRGNQVLPWAPSFDVARDGSVRISGAVDVLFANVPAGPWEIAVAVGRPETLPTAPSDILRGRDADGDAGAAAWRLVRERVRLGS